MTDHYPPRVFGDERTTLVALLQYLRESVVRKVEGLSDEDARRSFVPTGTSLMWLVKHLARAEALWVLERFAGQQVELELVDHASVRTTLSRRPSPAIVDLGSRCVSPLVWTDLVGVDEGSPLAWCSRTSWRYARHAGHADILRE